MPVPDYLVKRFGGLAKVPQYIKDHFKNRARLKREEQERLEEARREKEREYQRIKALRRPPTNVRLELTPNGRVGKIIWEPPETADELPPAGYWVSEERNGEWTAHGDYVLPHVRSATLFGTGPARVETWYHQMALGESYPSPVVTAQKPEPEPVKTEPALGAEKPQANAALIETLRGYLAEERGRPPIYYERWTRALAGLGAAEHDDPMTAAEAQKYADRGWKRWVPVVKALRQIETNGP